MESEKKVDPVNDSKIYASKETLSSDSSIESNIHKIDPLEDSPIEEVRSAVPPTDDHTLPTATFRSWFWGIIFSAAISFSNQV